MQDNHHDKRQTSPRPTSILDHPLVGARYFFPGPDHFAHPVMVNVEGARLACYHHHMHPGALTLVHFHGNGEVIGDYLDDFLEDLDRLEVNCFFAEYRGYGMSTGTPSLVQMLGDVSHILEATGLPEEKLVPFGRSVGSIYALEAAYRYPKVAGLILESGIASPLERVMLRVHPGELGVTMEEARAEATAHLDHEKKLSAYPGPSLILHAREDGLVDVSNARRLHQWAGDRAALKLFELGDHNSVLYLNRSEYFETVRRFLDSLIDSG